MRKSLTLALLAGLLTANVHNVHAADVSASGQQICIGFRSDGWSGVCPDDCKPPKDFDGVTGKNLKWKAELPNHSNSSPIVVAKEVFVVCDAGWPEGADCPSLLCCDTDTGKRLWQKPIDPYDNLPEAEAKSARADRVEYWQQFRKMNRLAYEWSQTTDANKRTTLLTEMQPFYSGNRGLSDLLVGTYKIGPGSGPTAPSTCGLHASVPGDKELRKRLAKYGFGMPTWNWICMGMTMPTPASDGQRVYVVTGLKTATAFDLDGNKVWQVYHQNVKPIRSHWVELCANSPFIVEGRLLMHLWDRLWCYDPATGKVLWEAPTQLIPAHSMGQPTVLHLPSAKGLPITAIFCTSGQLIRLSDGKLLADKVGWFGGNAIMSGDGKGLVWGRNGAEGGKAPADRLHGDLTGVFAVRFKLAPDGERTETEVAWRNEEPAVKTAWGIYPTYWKGQIVLSYGGMRLDAATGKVLASFKGVRGTPIGYNGTILADNRLIGFPRDVTGSRIRGGDVKDGRFVVRWVSTTGAEVGPHQDNVLEIPMKYRDPASLPAAQRDKVIAQTGGLGWATSNHYGWQPSLSAPFASGNCLYVRTYDALYCFGREAEQK